MKRSFSSCFSFRRVVYPTFFMLVLIIQMAEGWIMHFSQDGENEHFNETFQPSQEPISVPILTEKPPPQTEKVEPDELLLISVQRCDLLGVSKALELGGDVNRPRFAVSRNTILMEAIEKNCASVANYLLTKNNGGAIDVFALNERGERALLIAFTKGQYEIVTRLLRDFNENANSLVGNNNAVTLLIKALKKPDFKMAEILLKYGAKVDARDEDGNTVAVLTVKTSQNDTQFLELLFSNNYGVSVNETDSSGQTLLKIAVRLCKDNVTVPFLISRGAWPREIRLELVCAIKQNLTRVVEDLLALATHDQIDEVDPDDKNRTLLMKAIVQGNKYIVVMLLQRNASVDRQDVDGYDALFLAVDKRRPDLVEILLKQSAVINRRYGPYAESLLMKAIRRGNFPITYMLLEQGADPKYVDNHNCNAAQLAIQTRGDDTRFLEELLKRGVTVNDKGEGGASLLEFALKDCTEKKSGIVQYLIDKGAKRMYGLELYCAAKQGLFEETYQKMKSQFPDFNIDTLDSRGQTALMKIAQENWTNAEIAKLFLDRGACVECEEISTGFTPLMYAVLGHNAPAFELLFSSDANLMAVDKKGRSIGELSKLVPGITSKMICTISQKRDVWYCKKTATCCDMVRNTRCDPLDPWHITCETL